MPDNPQPPLTEYPALRRHFERHAASLIKTMLNRPMRSTSRIFMDTNCGGEE